MSADKAIIEQNGLLLTIRIRGPVGGRQAVELIDQIELIAAQIRQEAGSPSKNTETNL